MTSTTQSSPTQLRRRKWVKRVVIVLLAIPVAAVLLIVVRSKLDARIDYDVSTDGITIPRFDTVGIEFEHHYAAATSIETTAGAVLNLDNDGAEELFLGGGEGQQDALFRFVERTVPVRRRGLRRCHGGLGAKKDDRRSNDECRVAGR
ncbi:MAG: hypothetical protein JRJ24_21075 [Deltaproteobacteria bacterium]|nr:hypothetical protein [Deltaproteobacteria bacterium]